MTFTHADIEQRWLELVYDEVDAATRAAFDAHTAGCSSCQAKVAALAQTRQAARAVARSHLDDSAPPSVRARVMEAAARAVAERGTIVAAGTSSAIKLSDAGGASRWGWLRRRWTLPMFATLTAAAATLLLGRDTIFREAHRPLGEAPPAEVAMPLAPAEPESDSVGGSTEILRSTANQPAVEAGARRASKASDTKATGMNSSDRAAKKRDPTRPRIPKWAASPPRKAQAPAVTSGAVEDLLDGNSLAKGRQDDLLSGSGSRSRSRSSASDDVLGGMGAAPTAAAAGAPAAPASPARAPQLLAPEPSRAAGVREASPAASTGVDDPAMIDSTRADKLYAARRWTEAAAVYRELVERFPRHRLVVTWRGKLAAAHAAAASQKDSGRFAQPPPPP